MRTHMLVALGACAVMTTSQMIFWQYRPRPVMTWALRRAGSGVAPKGRYCQKIIWLVVITAQAPLRKFISDLSADPHTSSVTSDRSRM